MKHSNGFMHFYRILVISFFAFFSGHLSLHAAPLGAAETEVRARLEAQDPAGALDVISEALQSGLESTELYHLQAEAFFSLGEIDESLKSLAAYEILWRLKGGQSQ